MDLKSILGLKKVPNVQIVENKYTYDNVGRLESPIKIDENNAFTLASAVSELNFPIDFIADRGSKLRFFIADESGNEVNNTEFTRFISKPNPFSTINTLFYDWAFSYLADGNGLMYRTVPTSLSGGSVNISKISRVDVLDPSLLTLKEYSNKSRLTASGLKDLINSAKYTHGTSKDMPLEIENISISNIDTCFKTDSNVLVKSPLLKATRAVNNLLAAYSARYNVYVNNGAAGYLVKKNSSLDAGMGAIVNPGDREAILRDVNNRNGLTGSKHLYGISSVPLEFINTLVHIKDLMPFDECENDAIQIGGIYQLNPNLLPRREQAKYENQSEAEKSVWENTITSVVDEFCRVFSEFIGLSPFNYTLMADYSSVSALAINEKANEEVTSLKIDNLLKISASNPSFQTMVDAEIEKIIDSYGK